MVSAVAGRPEPLAGLVDLPIARRGGGAQRLKQRARRFGAHAVRKAVQMAGKGQAVKRKRLGTLRAPAVARRIAGGDVRYGITCDALHGGGKNMMGGERRHRASSLGTEILDNG